jgi:hypothetical protein
MGEGFSKLGVIYVNKMPDEARRPIKASRTVDVRAELCAQDAGVFSAAEEDCSIMSFDVPQNGEILKIEISGVVVHVGQKKLLLDTSNLTY